CSTNSTNRYLSGGRLRRNASFSSDELTVIVHTVVLSACAAGAAIDSATSARTRAVQKRMVADESGSGRRHCTAAPSRRPSDGGRNRDRAIRYRRSDGN